MKTVQTALVAATLLLMCVADFALVSLYLVGK